MHILISLATAVLLTVLVGRLYSRDRRDGMLRVGRFWYYGAGYLE